MQKIEQIPIYNEQELDQINLHLQPGDRIFFYGDLGSGKTSLIRSLLRRQLHDPNLVVRSPTYTYYSRFPLPDKNIRDNKVPEPATYNLQTATAIYHFDLYRIEHIDTFSLIGGDEIWDDPTAICLIEWPERIEGKYTPTKIVRIEKSGENERTITLEYR